MISLVQISSPEAVRRVGLVKGARIDLLSGIGSAYEIVQRAIALKSPVRDLVFGFEIDDQLNYDDIYYGRSAWITLPPFDHPLEPARCYVTGTGLTHLSSAATRQSMHSVQAEETDSIRMYRWGVEGGRPASGLIGSAPEWFYKGNGSILRAHGQALSVPDFAEDGGEEPEIAGIYLIDERGCPRRVGFAVGNEFSDHKLERRNYLYLAHSKLRECALGPELVLDSDFQSFCGHVRVERCGTTLWEKQIRSGEENMCHSLVNIEHHHFKYLAHRRPGDVHIHFFGADAFSFGSGITLSEGDIVEISFQQLGCPLRNPIHICGGPDALMTVKPA
jgi:hypothetical protein